MSHLDVVAIKSIAQQPTKFYTFFKSLHVQLLICHPPCKPTKKDNFRFSCPTQSRIWLEITCLPFPLDTLEIYVLGLDSSMEFETEQHCQSDNFAPAYLLLPQSLLRCN